MTVESEQGPLLLVVEEAETESMIDTLDAAGIYDRTRKVRDHGCGENAIPITEVPAEDLHGSVIVDANPAYRHRDLDSILAAAGWTEKQREHVPRSWHRIGSVCLVRMPTGCHDETGLARALMRLHTEIDTVLAFDGVATEGRAGVVRKPQTRHVLGATDTETTHTEADITYVLDPASVLFSPGNHAERQHMGSLIERQRSENPTRTDHVFDMFAGIGYFTLPMAAAGAHVTATEVNPVAFRYLLEGAKLNGVTDRIHAYRCDCRDIAENVDVDRVVMGYYGFAPEDSPENHRDCDGTTYLDVALEAITHGGTIHFHDLVSESDGWQRRWGQIDAIASRAGWVVELVDRRVVKSYSPGVDHVVFDIRCQ